MFQTWLNQRGIAASCLEEVTVALEVHGSESPTLRFRFSNKNCWNPSHVQGVNYVNRVIVDGSKIPASWVGV